MGLIGCKLTSCGLSPLEVAVFSTGRDVGECEDDLVFIRFTIFILSHIIRARLIRPGIAWVIRLYGEELREEAFAGRAGRLLWVGRRRWNDCFGERWSVGTAVVGLTWVLRAAANITIIAFVERSVGRAA